MLWQRRGVLFLWICDGVNDPRSPNQLSRDDPFLVTPVVVIYRFMPSIHNSHNLVRISISVYSCQQSYDRHCDTPRRKSISWERDVIINALNLSFDIIFLFL